MLAEFFRAKLVKSPSPTYYQQAPWGVLQRLWFQDDFGISHFKFTMTKKKNVEKKNRWKQQTLGNSPQFSYRVPRISQQTPLYKNIPWGEARGAWARGACLEEAKEWGRDFLPPMVIMVIDLPSGKHTKNYGKIHHAMYG